MTPLLLPSVGKQNWRCLSFPLLSSHLHLFSSLSLSSSLSSLLLFSLLLCGVFCVVLCCVVCCALCVLLVCNVWVLVVCVLAWCWCVTLTPSSHPSLSVYVQNARVCAFKTFPCVLAPRPQVLPHAGVVPVHTGTFLNVHTGVFSVPCHTTPHAHTTTTMTYTTQHSNNTQHHTGNEGRERQRKKTENER